MKLRSQLVVMAGLLVVSLTAATTATVYFLERRHLAAQIDAYNDRTLHNLAGVCRDSIISRDQAPLLSYMSELRKDKTIRWAAFYDADGALLLHSEPGHIPGDRRADPGLARGISSGGPARYAVGEPPHRMITWSAPVETKGRRAGTAFVAFDAASLEARVAAPLREVAARLLTAALFALALGSVAAGFLAHALSRPLATLTAGAREIGRGNLAHRIPLSRSDEIGELTEEFNGMAVKLSRLDELKDDFVNAVSHDLRNPLAAIDMAIAQLLEGASGTLTPSQITVLGSIRRSSRRLTEMVNNVLDVAKMKSGAMGLTIEPVDVEAIVRELVQLYATAAAQKKITLRVDVDPELPLLDLDEEKVHRIFLNLLNNALKFTLSGGEITLGLKAGKDGMDCSVADTGIGISAQDLPRIFERFITADGDDPAAKHHHGTGLGLTIVREFIDLLGAGPIHVESERGRGTTFRWTFRSVEAPPQAADKS